MSPCAYIALGNTYSALSAKDGLWSVASMPVPLSHSPTHHIVLSIHFHPAHTMHIIVFFRCVFFSLCLSFRIAVITVSVISLQEGVPLVGSPATLFVAVPSGLFLLGLLLFDLYRSRTGFNFFSIVCKIWFELIIMVFLLAADLLVFIVLVLNQRYTSDEDPAALVKPCQALQLICIFQGFTTATVLSYVILLGTVTWKHYNKTPTVLSSTVRDFQWDTRSKSAVSDEKRLIQGMQTFKYPSVTQVEIY